MNDDWLANVGNTFNNPKPVVLKDTDLFVSDFLSPARLRKISGKNDLNTVDSIEMVVNTSETTLGNFGQYLPNMTQLKLNDSCIPSIRDIGTSFVNLNVLWISRCRVNEIDGIASMLSLQELYIAYNNIADLSPLSFLENLEVLDLEGNKVSEVDQIDYLVILSNLTTLTLSGNPVCTNYCPKSKKSFRQYVLKYLPQLQQLDDISAKISMPKLSAISHSQEDIDIITNAIKEGVDLESNLRSISPDPSKTTQDTEESLNSHLPSTFCMPPLKTFTTTRPATAAVSARRRQGLLDESSFLVSSGLTSRPGSSDSDNGFIAYDDLSSLTIGDPLCGNPLQALKQRKKGAMPAFSFLSNDIENSAVNSRPMTSLGFRHLPISLSSTPDVDESKFPQNLNSNPCSRKDGGSSVCKSNIMEDLSKSNGICKFKSPSPPLMNMSLTKPYKSPTPPPSPQRPSSTQDLRPLRRRRRTFPSSGTSRSLSVVTVNSVENPCRHPPNSIQSPIEDQST